MKDLSRAVASLFCIGFDGHAMTSEVGALLDRGVGSVILFGRNVSSVGQVAELTGEIKRRAGRPVMINIDQEGGRVMRVREKVTAIPSMRVVGKANNPSLTWELGALMAREMRALGIDQINAPVLDVDTNAANPVIADRSFGGTPERVAAHGVALLQGIQSAGVAACGKHFPGHGDTAVDSHFAMPTLPHSMERLEEVELAPFKAAVDAGVASLMTAHVMYEPMDAVYPATLSRVMIHDIVREKFGFEGVVYSDDLEMKAIVDNFGVENAVIRALSAGVDVFCVCHTAELQHRAIEGMIRAVEKDTELRASLEQAVKRVERLMEKYYQPAEERVDLSVLNCEGHQRVVGEIQRLAQSAAPGEVLHDPTSVMDILTKRP